MTMTYISQLNDFVIYCFNSDFYLLYDLQLTNLAYSSFLTATQTVKYNFMTLTYISWSNHFFIF